ncbi:MAG: substrate-binding domain-containing protein [Casimicrobiaceae bacterium]
MVRGTRQLLDSLLASARINSRNGDGYARHEFTHAAVAATIAAESADA